MAKLHEILAVENSLSKASEKLIAESKKTFGKENLFTGSLRKLNLFDDSQKHLETEDVVKLETTVDENINYLIDPISNYWDCVLQKDKTNQLANADIVIDGITIAQQIPATFLLGLETKLGEIRKLYDSIHTLSPGIKWSEDTSERPGIFISQDNIAFKTEKDIEFRIVVEADQYHPAQIRELGRVNNIGRYDTTKWSGLLTPLEKAKRIQRIDKLMIAVKKARQRANTTELQQGEIGKSLFNYING